MSGLEFWTNDRRFGLRLSKHQVWQILRMCVCANGTEVGGILVGVYTSAHDCAIVKVVSGAPPDSQSGRAWFNRGVHGLQVWLDLQWYRRRHYYVGEWHFHPHGLPVPSQTDIRQMTSIASSARYRCPEPVLLIIGGDPAAEWSVKAFVFPVGQDSAELIKCSDVTRSESDSNEEEKEQRL